MYTTFAQAQALPNSLLRRFEQERIALEQNITGLPAFISPGHYSSLLFRRLLVLALLQAHSFLDADPCYLVRQLQLFATSSDRFFYDCLRPLFAQLASSPTQSDRLPALDLPLFALQSYETSPLFIPDQAFSRIFDFFSTFEWSLSPPPLRAAHVLGPEILAALFEQQLDQKQFGAYYTHADITLYTTTNTIIPYLLQALTRRTTNSFSLGSLLLSLLQANPERYILLPLSTSEHLPLESEWDFSSRRSRYKHLLTQIHQGTLTSIADLVSANLDLRQLLQDALTTSDNPEFIFSFYTLLSQITILDPTCGAGAFLMAACELLQSLYATCLDHFPALLHYSTITPQQKELCTNTLSLIKQAPNQAFFIMERCITTNLYGVDIMDEAVEMCRLCLYLTLLASLEPVHTLPLFSPFSFQIRAGNALAGFVHPPAEVDTSRDEGESLQLDILLARSQGIMLDGDSKNQVYLTQWSKKQRPFHWYLQFPSCIQQGGFDVIIGNPPFVEYHKTDGQALFSDYQTQQAGNLYALVIERVLMLCRAEESFLGLLVPLSLCTARRFESLRNLLLTRTSQLWLANFSIFPCRLFEGAFQRLSLLLAHTATGQVCQLSTTHIQRWYSAERAFLLPLISYTPVIQASHTLFPKLASSLQAQLLARLAIRSQGKTLASFLQASPTSYFVYYQEATNYWTKASCTIPYYKKNGREMYPSHGRLLHFSDQCTAQVVMAILNSSLFYLWFSTYSDGFHLSHALVKSFPMGDDLCTTTNMVLYARLLQETIQQHARRSTRNTQDRAQIHPRHLIELEEFHMSYAKSLLDTIDGVLADYYQLTHEELDFILHFDSKYRE